MTWNPSQDIRDAFDLGGAEITAITTGHINTTLLVSRGDKKSVLQRLNPIFGEEVHRDIQAITALVDNAVAMPALIPTVAGDLWLKTSTGEVWRMLEWMPGETHLRANSLEMCESAGQLVGRFHRALHGKEHTFYHRRLGVHDTSSHLHTLTQALQEHREHRAFDAVSALARQVCERLESMDDLSQFPERICHGDLKISNLLFDGQTATTLIDLDTLAPKPLAHEMGDALRSWCNLSDEESQDAVFSLSYFEASLRGYCEQTRGLFEPKEQLSIVCGLETIALELTVRFLADALNESYFGWDASSYGSASEHNLKRAHGQWAFARSVGVQRQEATEILQGLLTQS